MKTKKAIGLIFSIAVLAVATSARADTIIDPGLNNPFTSSPWQPGVNMWTGTNTNNLSAADILGIVGGSSTLVTLFKTDGGGSCQSCFTWTNPQTEAGGGLTGGTITFVGQNLSGPLYLYVKDGNQGNPAYYIFDISGWDGQDALVLQNFWNGTNGSISHAAIIGTGTSVPEPATLLLLGAGLIGLGLFARKR